MRILLVEDNVDMRFLIARMLKREGYEVVESDDGSYASEMLKTDSQFHIILCDTQMPLMDGFQLLQEIKQEYPHILFILMTSAPTPEWSVKGKELGADYCLLKPETKEDVLNALRAVQMKP
jgi:CheY-like chemotaxis protein